MMFGHSTKNDIVWYLSLHTLLILIILTYSASCQRQNEQPVDDLTFNYKEKPENEPPRATSRRPPNSRPSRTSTNRPLTKSPISAAAPNQKTSTSKSASGLILTSPLLLQTVQLANLPPFLYADEKINQTHADMFSKWIDSKSNELFELSMNYSGFKLLNETYQVHLSKDARPAWINFTEMIMNISETISEVLNHKTLIVKNLTDLIEKAFDEYRKDPERILESTKSLYYDAKSPKTFCDVQEASLARSAKLNQTNSTNATSTVAPINASTVTVSSNLKVFRI